AAAARSVASPLRWNPSIRTADPVGPVQGNAAMFTGITGVLVVVGIVVLAGLGWIATAFNRLVALKNRFKTAYSQIDVQLKRRYDLIPNLIETAKGYLNPERQTLEAVVQARNSALAASRTAAAT